jgi:hypothetical protein
VHLKENFLHHVVHVPSATEQALDQPRDVTSVLPKELSERCGVASLAA